MSRLNKFLAGLAAGVYLAPALARGVFYLAAAWAMLHVARAVDAYATLLKLATTGAAL